MSVIDPVTGRRSWATREDYNAYIASRPPPTPDDVTVLEDGTRIDTAEKGLAYAAQLQAELEAAHARDAAIAMERPPGQPTSTPAARTEPAIRR